MRGRFEAYQARTSKGGDGGESDDAGTTVTVCSGLYGGSVLVDGGGGAWTAAAEVQHACGGDSVFIRTDLRGAFMRVMSVSLK